MQTSGFSARVFLQEGLAARHGWWLLLVLAGLLLLPGTVSMPLIDRDEPRFAQATVEMMERGEWVIPYFNGDYRFDKPPLTYWWMRLHYTLFGENAFAARLHSVLAAYLTALAIAGLGRRLFSAVGGLLAGAAWLSSLQVMIHGRLAVADMPMVLAVTLAMWALWELLAPHQEDDCPHPFWRNRWFWVLWGSLALGFLAKGPIAWLVPLLALLLYRGMRWKAPLPWRRLHILPGLLVSLLPVAAWGVPALIQTEGAFWEVGMGKHIVERGFESFNERRVVPAYFFVTAFLSLFPWIAWLGVIFTRPRRDYDPRRLFLFAWFIAPFLIFLFYSTQLPHYTMPGFPAFFLLVAASAGKLEPWRGWSKAVFWVVLGVWALVIVALAYGVLWPGWEDALPVLRGAIAAFVALLAGLWVLAVGARFARLSLLLVGLLIAVVAPLVMALRLREVAVTTQLAPWLQEAVEGEGAARMLAWGFTEPGLVFYSGGRWNFPSEASALAEALDSTEPPAAILALEKEWLPDDLLGAVATGQATDPLPGRDYTDTLSQLEAQGWEPVRVRGLNFARSSWVQVVLWLPEAEAR